MQRQLAAPGSEPADGLVRRQVNRQRRAVSLEACAEPVARLRAPLPFNRRGHHREPPPGVQPLPGPLEPGQLGGRVRPQKADPDDPAAQSEQHQRLPRPQVEQPQRRRHLPNPRRLRRPLRPKAQPGRIREHRPRRQHQRHIDPIDPPRGPILVHLPLIPSDRRLPDSPHRTPPPSSLEPTTPPHPASGAIGHSNTAYDYRLHPKHAARRPAPRSCDPKALHGARVNRTMWPSAQRRTRLDQSWGLV